MQADSHDVLLLKKKKMVNRPASPSSLCLYQMQKVVSVEIQCHCPWHRDPFSCMGWCNSRSIPGHQQHHGEAGQSGTGDLIHWLHLLNLENDKIRINDLRSLSVWEPHDSDGIVSGDFVHTGDTDEGKCAPSIFALFSRWLKLVLEMQVASVF